LFIRGAKQRYQFDRQLVAPDKASGSHSTRRLVISGAWMECATIQGKTADAKPPRMLRQLCY
jgi:hypothetical protein